MEKPRNYKPYYVIGAGMLSLVLPIKFGAAASSQVESAQKLIDQNEATNPDYAKRWEDYKSLKENERDKMITLTGLYAASTVLGAAYVSRNQKQQSIEEQAREPVQAALARNN